jgi:hypothetical protein
MLTKVWRIIIVGYRVTVIEIVAENKNQLEGWISVTLTVLLAKDNDMTRKHTGNRGDSQPMSTIQMGDKTN